jgi:hypothetical protein
MNARFAVAVVAALLLGIVGYKVVFVPTSLRMKSTPETIFAQSQSPVVVRAILTDKLGLRVPFRHLSGKFVVDEGAEKIDIVKTEGDEIEFRTKGMTGRLVILYYSDAVVFPVEIVLNITGSAVASLN